MKVTVCIGSSCHIKGSRAVVERLQQLIEENKLEEKVDLAGTFCLGKCQTGVNVMIEDEHFSVTPEGVDEFFNQSILPNI